MGRFVDFNQTGFIAALRKRIESVLATVGTSVYRHMLYNLAQLKVRKVDAEHVATFPQAIKMTNKSMTDAFIKSIRMRNEGQNQSFRALYYEYGTGANMRPPKGWSPFDPANNWNEARPKQDKAPIYYRGGRWKDLGGNWHKGGVRPGVKKLIPRKNIYGHPVRAHFWFRNALKDGTKDLDKLILQAVKDVPVTAYIKIRDIRVRM